MAFDLHLLPVFDALVYLHTTSSPDEVKFALAEDRADACLEVKVENDGQLGFIILDDQITQHGLHHLAFKITPHFDAALRVLRDAAHYFHQLHLSQHNRDVEEHIDIQFLPVKKAADGFSYRTATGPNLIKDGIVSLEIGDDVEGDEPVYYGVKILNNTSRDLYPHVFLFNSGDFTISTYSSFSNSVLTRCVIGSFSDKIDAALRSKQSLKIGYGGGGRGPIGFYIPDDEDVDVSFLKFIFSTKLVNLENVERESPFLSSGRATKSVPPVNVDEWGSILIPIAQKRRSRQV